MKVSYFVVVFSIIYVSASEITLSGNSSGSDDGEVIREQWIEQRLDHFNDQDERVWDMRYFERTDMWQPGGPIIVLIGGEFVAVTDYLNQGMAYDLVNETKGAAYMSEHRYYGKTKTVNSSKLDNFQYLSSRQALADLNYLIQNLKRMPKYMESKVVVIGGSYAGNLAVWMRLLYPQVVNAAIASSAPVLAKVDFSEFYETVGNNYRTYGGENCYNEIKSIFKRYEDLFQTPEGINTLKLEEKICEKTNMTLVENQQMFTFIKAGIFRKKSQYGNPDEIKSHCERSTQTNNSNNSDPQFYKNALAKGDLNLSFLWDEHLNCTNINFHEMVLMVKLSRSFITSWMHQTCNEFSYAITTSSDNQPFGKGIPLSSFINLYRLTCGDKFNEDFVMDSIKQTNKFYGGRAPNVTKVVFLNGDMDPWHRLGVTTDLSDEAPAILIPKAHHCQDLYPSMDGDSVELTNARLRAKDLVKSWIGYAEE